MNPQSAQGSNPYLQLLNHLQSGGPQAPGQNPGAGAMMQHMTPPGGGSQPGGAPVSALAQAQGAAQGGAPAGGAPGMAPQPDIEDAAIPGQNPGISKNLMGAMNQLHGAITEMTDPDEIRMIRSIIVLLNQLIQRDQDTQNQRTGTMAPTQPGQSNLGGGGPQVPGPQAPGPMPTGLHPGAPSPTA